MLPTPTLAAVGHEPLGQRSAAMARQQGQRGVEQCRQQQGRRQ
jgi:hypothetical protein